MLKGNEIGAVVLRVFLGLTFFLHGLAKFQGGIANTAGFFESLGFPGFSAYVVAIIELVGGIALILGVGTRVVSALLVVILLVATFKVKLAAGFMGNGKAAGYELDLALMAIALYFATTKQSALALDNVLFRSRSAQM